MNLKVFIFGVLAILIVLEVWGMCRLASLADEQEQKYFEKGNEEE